MADIIGSGGTGPTDGDDFPVEGGQPPRTAGARPHLITIDPGEPERLRDLAARLIRDRAFADNRLETAKAVLIQALLLDPDDLAGKTNHLLGLTYFHMESWEGAKRHLATAAGRDLANAAAKELLGLAETNSHTRVDRPMGPTDPFNPAELLRPPALALREPENIEPLQPARKHGPFALLLRGLGVVLGVAVNGLILILDALRERKVLFAFESWDRRGLLRGQAELAGIRMRLNRDKLQSTYDGLVGHQPPGQRRPAWTERFRTATGAWTTDDPMEGAAGTEIQRTGWPASKRHNRADDRDLPSPREVSRLMLAAHGPRENVPFLNLLTIAWIQPQVHDWLSHRPTGAEGAYVVKLAADDPLRASHGIGALHVPKSASNPIPQPGKLTYLNESTHWWDASHIYGSDQATQDRLRTGADGAFLPDGKLRMDGDLLPLDAESGIEDTGFARNWWVGPSLFHTLFVRHHNFICDVLKQGHPKWSTDQLFHTARLVNAAIMAKIHTVEWTPAVLPNRKIVKGMAANWWGIIEALSRRFGRRRIRRWYEPVHEVLGGIVGGERSNHGKPYGLSEEFGEIYRFHAAIPDAVEVLPLGSKEPAARVPTDATRGAMARRLLEQHGMATLLNSFGHQHMPALVHNNYPAFMSAVSVEGQAVIDLGAVDILRARERGVPPYNEFRDMLGLKPVEKFEDLGCDAATVANLERLYGKHKGIEKMDLLVGTSCELRRPEHFGIGETMFTVFIQMASRRLQADPFYTEKFDARYYSEEGMDLVERATLKDILLQHYPELAATGLARVNNAFEPWGTSAATYPAEHPLSKAERYQ